MPRGIYNRTKMKTDQASNVPIQPSKGVGPQIKIGDGMVDDGPPPRVPAAAVESLTALASQPAANETVDVLGNPIPKASREEALAMALMNLVQKTDSVLGHPEVKLAFSMVQQAGKWSGAAGTLREELKAAKSLLGIQ